MYKAALIFIGMTAILFCVFCMPVMGYAVEAQKIKVLIITGDDVGAHKWQETTPCTKAILDKTGKFDITVVEGLTTLNSKDELAKYDVLYYMLYNNKKVELSDDAKSNLLNFVKTGKGIVISHLASASFPKWEEWGKLCGRYWQMGKSGHGPSGEFENKVIVKDHPITKCLENFKTSDELYAKLLGEGKINILVTADSDWSKKTEPMVWTLNYDKGRVACHTFGHDKKSFESTGVQKVIVNTTLWAATEKTE